MVQKLLIFVSLLLFPCLVNASTYTTTTDLFENSYTNNLIDMAQTQIDNLYNKNYVILRTNDDYYMITADNYSINGTTINMNNTKIIRVLRLQNGYNYYYDYSTLEETSTTIYANNVIISNIDTTKSVSSSRFETYKQNKYSIMILTFILGLIFAIFLTKERSY